MSDALTTRLSWPTRIAYGIGIAPETWKGAAWDVFILFYYTQVLGMPGTLTGIAIAAALAIDAITDPLVGMWSDNLRNAPLGRRHTLMAASILPFAGAFAALFNPPQELSQLQLFAWLLCFAVITRVGITLWTIPFYATGSRAQPRSRVERSRLIAIRTIGSNAARFGLTWVAFTFFFVRTPGVSEAGSSTPLPIPGFGLTIALRIGRRGDDRSRSPSRFGPGCAANPRVATGSGVIPAPAPRHRVLKQFLPTIRLHAEHLHR